MIIVFSVKELSEKLLSVFPSQHREKSFFPELNYFFIRNTIFKKTENVQLFEKLFD